MRELYEEADRKQGHNYDWSSKEIETSALSHPATNGSHSHNYDWSSKEIETLASSLDSASSSVSQLWLIF